MSAPPRLRGIANLDGDAAEMLRAAKRTRPLTVDDQARLRPRLEAARAGLAVAKGGLIGAKGIASIVLVVVAAASSVVWTSRGGSAHSSRVATPAATNHVLPRSAQGLASPRTQAAPHLAQIDTAREPAPPESPIAPATVAPSGTETPTPIAATSTRRSHEVDSLAVEAAEIDDALTLLATNPAAALARIDRATHVHPRGQLASQREAIAVDALFRLQRDGEAIARGEALLAHHADGLAAARVRGLLRAHSAQDRR